MTNIGLKQNIERLEKEYERFKKAGESGYFCDTNSCFKTAFVLKNAIDYIKVLSKM